MAESNCNQQQESYAPIEPVMTPLGWAAMAVFLVLAILLAVFRPAQWWELMTACLVFAVIVPGMIPFIPDVLALAGEGMDQMHEGVEIIVGGGRRR